jgi:hypothetical protein
LEFQITTNHTSKTAQTSRHNSHTRHADRDICTGIGTGSKPDTCRWFGLCAITFGSPIWSLCRPYTRHTHRPVQRSRTLTSLTKAVDNSINLDPHATRPNNCQPRSECTYTGSGRRPMTGKLRSLVSIIRFAADWGSDSHCILSKMLSRGKLEAVIGIADCLRLSGELKCFRGLEAFRDSFCSTCAELGLRVSSDALQQFNN